MLFVLPVLFLVQKIDFTDPDNILKAQVIFGTVQSIVLLVLGYIFLQIRNSNNQTQISVPQPSSPFGAPTSGPQQMTIRDYDISQLRKFGQQILIGIVVAVVLFFKWDIVPPLAIQCVLNPMNLFGNPLFKLFVLNANPASHPRPFPEDNPLAGLMPTPPAVENDTDNTNEADADTSTKNSKKDSKKEK